MVRNKLNWLNHLGGSTENKFTEFLVGDSLQILYESTSGYWKGRTFVGLCISKKIDQRTGNCRYLLRNFIKGVSVEFAFDSNNPQIISVSRLPQRKILKLTTSKLTYLREHARSKSTVK